MSWGAMPGRQAHSLGKAAVISRGSCEFGVKVLNAEQAGAEFVVIYNTAAGGDGLINMGPGAVGNQVTISSHLRRPHSRPGAAPPL